MNFLSKKYYFCKYLYQKYPNISYFSLISKYKGLYIPGYQPIPVDPVVSDVIFDRKSHGDLSIVDYSPDWSFAGGGSKVLILCEKVSTKDIEVHFEYTDNSK